jgi:signal transduction histidine kinase
VGAPFADVIEAVFGLDEDELRALMQLERSATLRPIVRDLPATAGFDVAWFGELEGDELVLKHTVLARTDAVDGLHVERGIGLGGHVLVSNEPEWCEDYPALLTPFWRHANDEGVRAMIAVPVMHQGTTLGVLYGANRERFAYGDQVLTTMQSAARHAASALVLTDRTQRTAEIAVQDERRQLALQLHDTVGAMLFTIGAGVRKVSAAVDDDPELRGQLDTIQAQAAEASRMLRESLLALGDPPTSVALPVALRADCRSFEERTGTTARLVVLDELPALERRRGQALVATVREALLNVEKHACASSVLLTVFAVRGGVAVTVADDGVGIPDEGGRSVGLGLGASSERVARVGGELHTGRNDDGGTTVRAWVPG